MADCTGHCSAPGDGLLAPGSAHDAAAQHTHLGTLLRASAASSVKQEGVGEVKEVTLTLLQLGRELELLML